MKSNNQNIKKIVMDILKCPFRDLSVTRGRGTAHNWVYIKTKSQPTLQQMSDIRKILSKNTLCGHYYSDFGINDQWSECISFRRYDHSSW